MKSLLTLFTLVMALTVYSADRESVANGNWSNKCTWDAGCSANIPDQSDDVTINHDVVLDISLTGGSQIKGSLTIADGGSLTDAAGGSSFNMRIQNNGELILEGEISIEGNFELQGSSVLVIKDGATLTVSGDVDWSGSASIVVQSGGEINVGGTLTIDQNSDDINIDGIVNVAEDLVVGTGVDVTGDGKFVVEGDVDNGGILFDETADENCTDCIIPSQSLPVDLILFETSLVTETEVHIRWSTALEINNSHFELQRSMDALQWEVIETVSGKGTYVGTSIYETTDFMAVKEVLFYRLKQIDFDGAFELSEIRSVTPLEKPALPSISVIQGRLLLSGQGLLSTNFQVSIYNTSGQVLFAQQVAIVNHKAPVTLDFQLPKQEVLIIQLMDDQGILTSKKLFIW